MDNNNDIKGWVKMYRKSVNDPMYFEEKFTRWQAWQDLIVMAAYKPTYIYIRGNKVELKIGQLAVALRTLSIRWKWSINKVQKYINELEKDEKLTINRNTVINIISICKYKKYQQTNTQNDTQNDTQTNTQNDTQNKEIKEYNNNNNIFVDDDAARAREYIKCENREEDKNENENDRDGGVFDDVEEHYKIFKNEISGETQTRVSYQQLAKEFDVTMQPTQLVEYLDRWMARVRADGRKQMTYGDYRRYFKNWFLQTLGKERERRNTPTPYTPTPRTDHRLNVSKGIGGYSFTFNAKKQNNGKQD